LFALIALAIALDSRGPVLFSQQRLGQGGKPFAIFKFRTMRVLEDGMHVVQACKNDVRITRIGSFLRSTSLDELPQLLNVVLGSMSLVGPRPHAVAHDKLYGALIADYSQRQRAKPGITGWAQINGARGATPTTEDMRKRVDLDIWYVDNANLILDLRILLRTPLEVLRQRNAY
jgi:putative colanic acid biosynthesis UDP-glucose lipid carrier transferase